MGHVSRRAALCALGVATLAACVPGKSTEAEELDLRSVDDAVVSASTRVVSVKESKRQADGLGAALYYELRFDSSSPASVDDLDAIVAAVWRRSPVEPHTISVMAFADAAEQEPVDLRSAAAGLRPVRFDAFGEGGVSLVGMWRRYGDWVDPA